MPKSDIKMPCDNRISGLHYRKFCSNVIYISVHIILMITVLALIIQCLVVFSKWPTYTKIKVVPQNMAEFPAMTICPALLGYKEDVLQVIEVKFNA